MQYFLLQNGSDTTDCGKSLDSACLSLPHVLHLYYAEPPTMALQIKTDKSLIIDAPVLVSPTLPFHSSHKQNVTQLLFLPK